MEINYLFEKNLLKKKKNYCRKKFLRKKLCSKRILFEKIHVKILLKKLFYFNSLSIIRKILINIAESNFKSVRK